jgi:5'-nucleotidase
MNGGGVRSPGYGYRSSTAGEGDGNVTYGEAFAVQPFGNSLITMSLSARQIRDALEEQFAGCRGQSRSTTRLMLPSAGLRYAWDGAKPCDARISDVRLNRNGATEIIVDLEGRLPHPERRYRVTVNSFMADGGDGMSTFTHGTQRVAGMQDIDATIAFLSRYRTPHPPYDPSADEDAAGMPRLRRLGSGSSVCPTGADTNP